MMSALYVIKQLSSKVFQKLKAVLIYQVKRKGDYFAIRVLEGFKDKRCQYFHSCHVRLEIVVNMKIESRRPVHGIDLNTLHKTCKL